MTEVIETQVVVEKKLTKKEREFFHEYTKGILQNLLLAETNPEYTELVLKMSGEILADADIKTVSEGVARSVLAKVDFKEVAKVDTFLRSEPYLRVVSAIQEALAEQATPLSTEVLNIAKTINAKVAAEE